MRLNAPSQNLGDGLDWGADGFRGLAFLGRVDLRTMQGKFNRNHSDGGMGYAAGAVGPKERPFDRRARFLVKSRVPARLSNLDILHVA